MSETDTKQVAKTAMMDTAELREALQKVSIIRRNKNLPVLSNIKGVFAQGKATLTSTDLERTIIVEINSTNSEAFTALLPRTTAERFLAGGNGKTSIQIDTDPKRVRMSRESAGTLNLSTFAPDDFPPIPFSDKLEWQTLDADWFCRMLRTVSTACYTEEARPALKGVACNDGAIAAADGFRLAVLKDARLTFGLGDKQAIMPLDAVNLALKLFRNEKELKVAIELSEPEQTPRRIYFQSSGVTLLSEFTQGTYPNYGQLIPTSFACEVSFSAPLMAQRLGMIDPMAISGGTVRFKFDRTDLHKEHECTLLARSEEEYDYLLKLPIKIQSGESGAIAFNLKYALDAIRPFSVCNLEITSPSSPGKFTGDIEGLTIVVMPMWVQW